MTILNKPTLGTPRDSGWPYYSLHMATSLLLSEYFLVPKYKRSIQLSVKHGENTKREIGLIEKESGKKQPNAYRVVKIGLMLDHAVFRDMIREWLKTLRKANTAVVMATQSIDDVAKSGIMDVINSSCLTKVLLPNLAIYDDLIGTFYRDSLGLNPNEIDLLARAIMKQQYYYRSEKGKRLFELNLRPKTLAYVGRSSPDDSTKLRMMMEERPDDWRDYWLDYCTGKGMMNKVEEEVEQISEAIAG